MNQSLNNTSNLINSNRLIDQLNNLTQDKSIKQWDLGATTSKDLSVQVDKGEPKQLKASQRSTVTIRVWNMLGLVGTTSTSDLSEIGLRKAFQGAYQASQFGNPNEIPNFSPLCKAPLPELVKPVKDFVGIKNLLELLRDAESKLLNIHKAIQTVPYNGIGETLFERVYINSEGAMRHIKSSQASLYLYARAQEKSNKPRSSGAIRLSYSVDDLEIDSCINEAASRTIDHLNYKPIDTGKYLICFKPEAILDLIGAFSNMFNARSVIDGTSLSHKESLGKQIAVPSLSIYDNALHPSNYSSSSFDGEGTPTRNLCLINGGTLENFIHSETTARIFGVEPTGHAGIGSKVSVGLDWLVIGSSNEKDLLNSELNNKSYQGKYIMIEGLNALHSGIKASQGSFSLPFDGWLVNRGERTSIEAATVAGDIKEVLNKIIQIEEQQEITHQGVSPHIWVDGLTITGEE
ncbi:TldD/PmbA family protein [Prochlorococcus sp. MIT 1307]|uniref:TldD/PmbA family protein n=1 Tax=Prochlorococcus sp. MIT 1307 TaxID=3096219 RepID=UPI002A75105F|nr:TldD/PmbA family protein [Prochlorococcus sp. MIT 1307]